MEDRAERIPVGYVRRAHGIRGEVIVRPLTDDPASRFSAGSELRTDETEARTLSISTTREHRDGLIIGFVGIATRTDAEAMQGVTLTIGREERRALGDDEYWPEDLEDLTVIDPEGTHLGRVVAVVIGEAQDRLVVETGQGQRFEVPFVSPIVGEIHPSGGFVVIDAPQGLLE